MSISSTIEDVRSGVVRIALYLGSDQVGSGSGFLTRERLLTNSHVIRGRGDFDAVEITFGDQDVRQVVPIRLAKQDFHQYIRDESQEQHSDYAILEIPPEPEFSQRHDFEISSADDIAKVGDQVLFFGFPFGSKVLTSHIGYLSADYRDKGIHRLQIDGSINPGNSGGPLLHIDSGKVVAIITRTQTGLEEDFDDLVEAIANNERSLSQSGARITIGGLDPIQATRVTMTILGRVATNLRRTANVGIGWAYCAEHALDGGGLNAL